MKINFRKNKKRGFTILESLIAITIVLIAITTSFSVIPQGQTAIRRIKNRTTANYLAQEAIEIVRHKRDNGMFFDGYWKSDNEIVNCLGIECMVNSTTSGTEDGGDAQLIPCLAGGCEPLYVFDDANGKIYGNGDVFDDSGFTFEGNGVETIFTRWVEIEIVPNATAQALEEVIYDDCVNEFGDPDLCILGLSDENNDGVVDANDVEIKVTAHVAWTEGISNDLESVKEINLFNWFK